MQASVLILMTTYQGEAYIPEQIESIINQTYKNWSLLIRDDGSTDNSKEILSKYKQLDPRIHIAEDALKNLGPCANFAKLMQLAKTRQEHYIMLSDQDDVWDADKIAISLANMQELETKHTGDIPLLVHTDLRVVDQSLNEIAPSYWQYMHLTPSIAAELPKLLVQNVVTGCTIMMNRSLLELAADIPEGVIMHDWWIALIARIFGDILSVRQTTIAYRQHAKNRVGASKMRIKRFNLSKLRDSIRRTQIQAELFLKKFDKALPETQRKIISYYASLSHYGLVSRRTIAFKYGFSKNHFLKNIVFFLLL